MRRPKKTRQPEEFFFQTIEGSSVSSRPREGEVHHRLSVATVALGSRDCLRYLPG